MGMMEYDDAATKARGDTLRQDFGPPGDPGAGWVTFAVVMLSIAGVLAWSAIPAGALVGGWVVSATGNVALVYGVIGVLTICIAAFFRFFTALGDAQRYVDERAADEERVRGEAVAV